MPQKEKFKRKYKGERYRYIGKTICHTVLNMNL